MTANEPGICRFIPAHAGNTRHRPTGAPKAPVHPRACGEHLHLPKRRHKPFGSSPRMRGTPPERVPEENNNRFIPAHAGNTCRMHQWSKETSVHPRACGEHVCAHNRALVNAGSSPRMRGTLLWRNKQPRKARFIPAHAGNTRMPARCNARNPVHPRACGEHVSDSWLYPTARRFIPAHAGNTDFRPPLSSDFAVHPRACGEHLQTQVAEHQSTGSSPRMRGTRRAAVLPVASVRFIPAHAGNTWRGCLSQF